MWRPTSENEARLTFLRQSPHVRLELVVLVLHSIQEHAFSQIRPAFRVVHLVDEVMDFLHHVFERALEAAPGGDLPIERFHDGEQIAVERDVGAAGGLDRAHRYPPKLLTALDSSAWISRKFCAPVIVSIVSTRFCTPDSFRCPPAVATWR